MHMYKYINTCVNIHHIHIMYVHGYQIRPRNFTSSHILSPPLHVRAAPVLAKHPFILQHTILTSDISSLLFLCSYNCPHCYLWCATRSILLLNVSSVAYCLQYTVYHASYTHQYVPVLKYSSNLASQFTVHRYNSI